MMPLQAPLFTLLSPCYVSHSMSKDTWGGRFPNIQTWWDLPCMLFQTFLNLSHNSALVQLMFVTRQPSHARKSPKRRDPNVIITSPACTTCSIDFADSSASIRRV